MNNDHALLSGIRAGITATGSHSERWGDLRREVFTGPEAWTDLKTWCAGNAMDCQIAFGEASRKAQVQFTRQRKNAPPAPQPAAIA